MRILILGGTGYIGNVVTEHLLKNGHTLLLINRNRPRYLPGNSQPAWYECDRRDHEKLSRIISELKFECVIDLSGFRAADVRASSEAVRKHCPTYIFMSSVAVAPMAGGTVSEMPVYETAYNVRHESMYASEKTASEEILQDMNNLKVFIVRSAEIIGTNDLKEQYFFLRAFQDQDKILLPDGGRNVVHTTDVRDVAEAFEKLILFPDIPPGVYHVARPSAVTLENFIRNLFAVCGKNPDLISVPLEYIKISRKNLYYPFFPRSTVVHAEKLKIRTGFSPKHNLAESFTRSWKLFLSKQTRGSEISERQNPFSEPKKPCLLQPGEELRIIENWRQVLEGLRVKG